MNKEQQKMSKQVTSWTECLVCGLIWMAKTAGELCPVHPVLERESATTKRYEDKLEVAESQLLAKDALIASLKSEISKQNKAEDELLATGEKLAEEKDKPNG